MNGPAIAVEYSANKKLGGMSATHASKATCPITCALLKADQGIACYADRGKQAITTKRISKEPITDDVEIATLEADRIDELTGRHDLRVHVVGDCKTPEAAAIVGSAMVRHSQRKHKRAAYTYTHAWPVVKRDAWQGASVLGSADSPDQVPAIVAQGYAPAVIVNEYPNQDRAFTLHGVKFIPCPWLTRGISCVDCRLCLDSDKLKARGAGIAFIPEKNTSKRTR